MVGTHTGGNGATEGALTVVYGMILGALLLLVVQRYTTIEKQKALSKLHSLYEDKRS